MFSSFWKKKKKKDKVTTWKEVGNGLLNFGEIIL